MWCSSKKWSNLCRELGQRAGAGEVRFDVFCGQCNKQLAEDVNVNGLSIGIHSDVPMEIFCSCKCARAYEKEKGISLFRYGYNSLWDDKFIQTIESLENRLDNLVKV